MLELFHERNLTDGGRWSAFFTVEMDFFESNIFACLAVAAFENLEKKRS